jgi:hypothetical protein
VWDKCKDGGWVGRCWGLRTSPRRGSHIILHDGDTIVDISQKDGNGVVLIETYIKGDDTDLTESVYKRLLELGIPYEVQ